MTIILKFKLLPYTYEDILDKLVDVKFNHLVQKKSTPDVLVRKNSVN